MSIGCCTLSDITSETSNVVCPRCRGRLLGSWQWYVGVNSSVTELVADTRPILVITRYHRSGVIPLEEEAEGRGRRNTVFG